ncbi:hypothetical protein [Nevskia sp.]|uniref:hypothetical protein n=1 Tax=Nevskia sp. TaxID=1929292 RepID=UPI0025ECBD1A|nr:hypothetical protein [Nevskia sp.]
MRIAFRSLLCTALLALAACANLNPFRDAASDPPSATTVMTLNEIGEQYLRLVLALGEHDPDYVDAYYGPAATRDAVKQQALKPAAIEKQAQRLLAGVDGADSPQFQTRPEMVDLRRAYLTKQLASLVARAQMLQGRKFSFDEEARALYDTAAPHYQESDFAPALARIEKRLPIEKGDAERTLAERYNRYIERYAVPPAKLEAVMTLAIEEARVRSYNHMPIPVSEHFALSFVSAKPWSAYNWYQGKLQSRIEINTELPIPVSRVIELASHEGYPGHHVYNALLENGLVTGQNWQEFTVYALFSPQSLIAEGTADYGVGLAFPGKEKLAFTRALFKAAGLKAADAERYLDISDAAGALKPAGIEAARRYLDGKASADETIVWMQRFLLYSPERAAQRLKFIDKYRAYVINYSWGEELVRGHIERHANKKAGSPEQWQQFFQLISLPRTPTMLLAADQQAAVPEAAAPINDTPADVNNRADFDRYIASKPTVAAFQKRYPRVFMVLPGTIATREYRSDRSRYFPELDSEGRIIGGSFN